MALIKKLKKAKKATRMGAKFAVGTGKFLESAGATGTGRKIAAGGRVVRAGTRGQGMKAAPSFEAIQPPPGSRCHWRTRADAAGP